MRLIDCNETLRKVEQIPFIANENKAFHEGCRYMQKKVLRILHESKSVDAELVRHGHWNSNNDCSLCGMPAPTDDRIDFINILELNYCPYCGAKMDEVSE